MQVTKRFVNGMLWLLTVAAMIITALAISASWGSKGKQNIGQHFAAVSFVAGPMIIATVVLLVAALLTTETIEAVREPTSARAWCANCARRVDTEEVGLHRAQGHVVTED